MSICITTIAKEGIIMAADSRTTYFNTSREPFYKDTSNKLFLTSNNIGILTAGDAFVNSERISVFIESFITEQLEPDETVERTAQLLLEYFRNMDPNLKTEFHIAGYQQDSQSHSRYLYKVIINDNKCELININNINGCIHMGVREPINRLMQKATVEINELSRVDYTKPQITYDTFTLQDALDFSMFAIRTTIDYVSFLDRNKTVGGPIDILLIKPESAEWLQKKTLTVKEQEKSVHIELIQ
jgi:hypothetical protein